MTSTSFTDKASTHHVTLTDRNGISVGLILCNDKGEPAPVFNKTPVDRTALKTSSGQSQYSDFQYPYSPIVQDDWSGGRGLLDFERDSTRYFDGYRANTHRENKVFLGPQEQYSFMPGGLISMDCHVPGNVTSSRNITFTPSANYTMKQIWVLLKTWQPTASMTFYLYKDAALIAQKTLAVTDVQDMVSEWVALDFGSIALVTTSSYEIQFSASDSNRWSLGAGDTGSGYYIIESAGVDASVIYYQYREHQYAVVNKDAGGAPSVWMNGDRGACDSNAGQLNKLIDATKTWTVNRWAGCVARIIYGAGKGEYRTIVSNTATQLTLASDWKTTHTTTSDYVILASNYWRELTGHGLTVPVTSVLANNYVVYFAQGDSVLIRKHREYNNAGVWSETDWAAEAAGNYAVFLSYLPKDNKVWRGQNTDATGEVSVSSAPVVDYASNLVFGAVIKVAEKHAIINGMQCYPNEAGTESLWVYKDDIPVIVTGTSVEEINLPEMKLVKSEKNGAAVLKHGVYSFFTLGNGLERYYGSSIEDVGPNIGEGLPADRTGNIIALQGYPGRYFALIDAGSGGYSSVLEHSGSGWHEIYRGRKGCRIRGMGFQTIPGATIDRLWLYEGNIAIWIPYASDAVSELIDSNYKYTHEGTITLARMHAGMYNVQKLIQSLGVWSEDAAIGSQQIFISYRMDDDTTWLPVTSLLTFPNPANPACPYSSVTSPIANVSLSDVFGIAGKRIQLRIHLSTTDCTKTPVLMACLVNTVLRTQIKYMYHLTYRLMDDEPTLMLRTTDDFTKDKNAMDKLAILEEWCDADSDGILYMTSTSPLYNGKYVFLNPANVRQIATKPEPGRPWASNVYVCSTTVQEA